ncbi:1-acyl-sn-glycerol-3-phosphate acyltransferase PLS1-like [Phragmites australis]|uniref:1-acyl-sn-glycerol-3-phosphate acyltransferase PLS1-like n=1 Tax=Phragmites australis TaxID=29695 RepID=UPI002D795140|nr:1-acyl-sn-glycerol-3-phosphate acyltransferase PLS1-like [Phragmites australis]
MLHSSISHLPSPFPSPRTIKPGFSNNIHPPHHTPPTIKLQIRLACPVLFVAGGAATTEPPLAGAEGGGGARWRALPASPPVPPACTPRLEVAAAGMAVPLVLVVLPIGLLFLLSGLIVNIIQAILFMSIRPFSKSFYRRINRFLAELLWLQLVWVVDWWAGVKVQLHADEETYRSMGKEHALIISNHRSDIDWLIGWILAQRSGCLGSAIAVMKKSSKFLPVIGWSMWFAEYLFLERSWAKDEKILKRGLQRLKDFPRPFWLALFVEGTRFTPAKLLAAQEYAASQGLPAPRNVLIPRTKGFVSAVSVMRDFVPAIYDTTVIIPKDSPQPTMLRILKGQSSVVHVRMKRHAMSEMPKSDEDVSKWCKDIFVAKDTLLDKHLATGIFDEEIRPIGRPVKSLLVTLFWACLLLYGAFEFFKWTELLSTWKGVGFIVAGMALVTAVMHVFITFSQAERSSSAKAARDRVKKD